MKKLISFSLVISLIIVYLSAYTSLKHEHIGDWEYDEDAHWHITYCSLEICDIEEPPAENHIDENYDGFCDVCGYLITIDSSPVAQIVIDYEKELKDKINKLHEEKPESIFYYYPVDRIECIYILDRDAYADAIVEKYHMNNKFAKAKVSALNAIKMISIVFDRDDFTESIHQKIKEIKDEESLIENLFIDMNSELHESYMPKIEYYTDNAVELDFEATNGLINLDHGKSFIIKSKEEYDEYFNYLSEIAANYQKEQINAQKDLYDEEFFEENALIITKVITRGSGSIKLTVNNLYVFENKVYVVVRTDVPGICTDDVKYTHFTLKVKKSDVINANEVITLE